MSKAPRSKRSISAWRLSGAALMTPSARRKGSSHALGYACWLLVPLYFHREARHDLVPASPDVVRRNHFGARPQPGADGHRGREADLVPAVVDAEREPLGADQVLAEPVDHRERQVSVRDRGAEGAFGLRPLGVDVDPLVVARDLGEGVDQVLGDLAPVARPDLLADQLLELIDAVRGDVCHRFKAIRRPGPPAPATPSMGEASGDAIRYF